MPRIDKVLALRGGYSRKIAGSMIRQGRVQVDGEVFRKRSEHCSEDCHLTVDGYEIPKVNPILVFHKPAGVLTAMADSWDRPCVGDIVPPRYHIIGRLDQETRGLLLLGMDGKLTQRLLHPKRAVEREYIAVVDGEPDAGLIEKVASGVSTSVGLAKGEILSIEENRVRLIMREGRNRIVRRMLHNAGFSVLDLFRLRFGPFALHELEEGRVRPALPTEIHHLQQEEKTQCR